jgi:hypothetical protein
MLHGLAAGTDDIPAVAREVMGLLIQLVTGYKRTNDIRLAFNNGEIQGINNSWQSIRSTRRNELDTGQLQIIMQVTTKSHPELTEYSLSADFIKTENGKRLLEAVTQVHGESVRPYVVAPNTPKERVRVLRKAFDDTMKDAEFSPKPTKQKLISIRSAAKS